MILRITKVGSQTAVAEIEGDLCGYFARKAAELFDSCARNGVRSFVLDMENCSSIDSLGVELLRKLSIRQLRLVNMGWSIRETCRAEGYNWSQVDGYGTLGDALKSLRAKVTNQEQLALCDFTMHNLANYVLAGKEEEE
jgi:anti-anti-sigma regulatory factor